jgi:hypothetical protein
MSCGKLLWINIDNRIVVTKFEFLKIIIFRNIFSLGNFFWTFLKMSNFQKVRIKFSKNIDSLDDALNPEKIHKKMAA